jgi:hypothetical protein
MKYGNKSFQHINESEKRYILGLYKKMDLGNIFEVKYKTDIQELISDFGKSLETQKRYLSALFVNLPVNESVVILNNIKESSIKNLFGKNKVVLENYSLNYNNLITEEKSDLISELDKFHNFLQESMSLELDRINEQVLDYLKSKGSQFVDAAYDAGGKLYDAGKKALDVATQWLNYATDYIVKTGVGPFFEKLRSALFSVAGTAIQIIVSLTGPATAGIGPAIITGIWCILGLYDLYQITQGADGAWANFIIDVICALTAGSLGNVLGKFVGVAGKTLTQALEGLVLKGLGPYIIPVIYVIQKSISTVARWFTWGGNFAKTKLGIGWLADKVAPAIKYMSEIVEKLLVKLKLKPQEGLTTPLGQAGYVASKTVSSLIPSTVLRTTGALAARINPAIWGKLANLSSHEVGLIAGQTLEQGTMKAIEKEVNSNLKEKPTQQVLQWVDQNYGTAYSDAYLAYLGGKKMFKYQNGKYISAVENTANTLRGEPAYFDKQGKRIEQGVGALVGEKPTSAQGPRNQDYSGYQRFPLQLGKP